ncbi:MAG: VOC family protein [Desulfobacteraceae bacterium]|nr:VOC family protein [Desulfobacteraceae bacterium]
MEIDHIFICAAPKAQEAETLKEFGLTEGTANKHAGQGTACRRFFFRNAFIELLYLEDTAESKSELTKPAKLNERLLSRDKKASPFGICFRPTGDSEKQPPFPCWSYTPIYLPANLEINIGNAPVREPMWFFLPFGLRPDEAPIEKQRTFNHSKGLGEITSLHVIIPKIIKYSEPAICASKVKGVKIFQGDEHLLKVGFDYENRGQSYDFRPILPLVFNW